MKKLTVILLTLILVLSLTGCEEAISKLLYSNKGNSPDTVQAQEPSIPNTAPTLEDTPAQTDDPIIPAVSDEPDVSSPATTPVTAPDKTSTSDKKDDKKPGVEITASHSDVSLFSEGENFKFQPQNVPGIYACTYTSADEEVAAVDELTGEVTAVAPGMTTVKMHVECSEGQFDFDCTVRCRWKVEEPDPSDSESVSNENENETDTPSSSNETDSDKTDTPSSSGSNETTQPSSSSKPSLSGFVSTLQGKYDGLGMMMALDSQLMDNYYPGLSNIAAVEEVLIEESAISVSNKAIGLVRLSDNATTEDILAVQSILQSRINAQADGGAFYPDACETWENGVITSVSNCVGMFVYPDSAHSMANLFTDTFSN